MFQELAAKQPLLWRRLRLMVSVVERLIKKPVWSCQMCEQCVLHNTGFTCPMGHPNNMRSGPCGGVGPNGESEVKPNMRCVWLKAYERDSRLPWKGRIHLVNAAVNWSLKDRSSWLNFFSGADSRSLTVSPKHIPKDDVPKSNSEFARVLRGGKKWLLIGEMNPPIGVETIATLTCRNSIALQGDLLGAAGWGIKNVLFVTVNHMVVRHWRVCRFPAGQTHPRR